MIRARAPVRLDFAGGWTDVPPFSTWEGGAVVNATIALFVEAELELGGSRLRLHARDLNEVLDLPDAAALVGPGGLPLLRRWGHVRRWHRFLHPLTSEHMWANRER